MFTAIYKKTKSGYVAWVEEVPGVNTQGTTKRDAAENLRDAMKEFVATRRALTRKTYQKDQISRQRLSLA